MSFKLGNASLARLMECDNRLQGVARIAITDSPYDFGITCGHRGKEEQDRCVAQGLSKTPFPTSKHNKSPSLAFDFAVFKAGKIDWKDEKAYRAVAHHILEVARQNGVKLRWGGDFNRNGDETDDRFVDLPHIELDEV